MEATNKENYFEWTIPKAEDPNAPKKVDYRGALVDLLKPYTPVELEIESDLQYTTPELIQALEEHLGIMQGDPKAAGIDVPDLVDYMISLGYRRVNTGGLTLEWLLKKRSCPAAN